MEISANHSTYLNKMTDGLEDIPNELIIYIFNFLDLKTIYNCLFVNNKWRYIVSNFILRTERDWIKLNVSCLPDEYESVRIRTKLNNQELFYNVHLWLRVKYACSSQTSFYKCTDKIKCLQVYKDNIRLISSKCMESIKIDTLDPSVNQHNIDFDIQDCISYEENDRYNVIRLQKEFAFNCKLQCDDFLKFSHTSRLQKCSAVKLTPHGVYSSDPQQNLWCNKKEEDKFKVRYYGVGKVLEIDSFENKIYVLTSIGEVLCCIDDTYGLFLVCRLPCQIREEVRLMFNKNSVIVGVSPDEELNSVVLENRLYPNKWPPMMLYVRCPNLSCAKRHGFILILGFYDGKISIHLIKEITQKNFEPEIEINVKDFNDYQKEDPAVKCLDVYESLSEHHLIVATNICVYRVSLTYPRIFSNIL